MGGFSADISAWVKKAGDKSDAFCRIFCSEVAERVVMRTPRDTGFACAGWQAAINGQGGGSGSLDPSGGETVARVALTAAQVRAGDTFVMQNNVRYIRMLEHGWSNQAPNGMVSLTVAEAPQIAQQVLSMVKQLP
jgi:hypothetical protein